MDSVHARARLTPSGAAGRDGRVVASPAAVHWRSRLGLRRVDLTGAQILSSGPADRDGDAVVHLALPDRSTAELRLAVSDAAALRQQLLRTTAPPPAPDVAAPPAPTTLRPVPRGWGAIVCLVLGVLWMTAMLVPAATGYPATATVLGGDGEGFCDVTWQSDDGATLTGESDCSDEPAGTPLRVWVSGWPFDPEPATPGLVLEMTLFIGLPLVGGGAVRLLYLRWRRRALAEPHGMLLPEPPPAVPGAPQGPQALSGEGTASGVAKAFRRAWALVALGALSAGGLVVLTSVLDRMDAELMASGVRTSGTVVSIDENFRRNGGTASVRFAANGSPETHELSLGDLLYEYAEGQDVVVVYDPSAPDRFTVDDVVYEPGWGALVMTPLLGGAALAGPFGIWLVVANHRMRRLLRDRPWSPVGVRALHGDRCAWFTTADGAIWRSRTDGDSAWESGGGSFWHEWRPPEDLDESAWWVTDGRNAVFSPDAGTTLVRARRRTALPRRMRRQLAKAHAATGPARPAG